MSSIAAKQMAAGRAYGGNKEGLIPAYFEQEVLLWSKEKLILKMYDLFLVSNKKKDFVKMNRVLIELMSALNFDYEEQATRLYRLYEFCQRCIFQKKYDNAEYIIRELRDSWAQAFKLEI